MSDSTAALWAALIGAVAALIVGGFAFVAALKQVAKTAYTQRQQAFWQIRRDSYASFLLRVSEFSEAAGACYKTLVQDDSASDESVDRMVTAAVKVVDVATVLDLEAPDSPGLLAQIDKVRNGVLDVEGCVINWRRLLAGGVPPIAANGSHYQYKFRDAGIQLRDDERELRLLFRVDLHKEMES